ncbi:unnamed protein product [Ranitomeya imitator]|uniref:Uncharacterized protein n=1 Tax=Ranitomeya imitator TaxID=111125 RepID=A0ABN9M2Y0_9NEOB|nr:unnamed protein product [Ranitomeya imitator]
MINHLKISEILLNDLFFFIAQPPTVIGAFPTLFFGSCECFFFGVLGFAVYGKEAFHFSFYLQKRSKPFATTNFDRNTTGKGSYKFIDPKHPTLYNAEYPLNRPAKKKKEKVEEPEHRARYFSCPLTGQISSPVGALTELPVWICRGPSSTRSKQGGWDRKKMGGAAPGKATPPQPERPQVFWGPNLTFSPGAVFFTYAPDYFGKCTFGYKGTFCFQMNPKL